jgi:mRNA interferase MazF
MIEISRGDVVMLRATPAQKDGQIAVVIQSPLFASLPSVLVCPLATDELDAPLLRIRVDSSERLPLPMAGWIMVELLSAVRRDACRTVIGRISLEEQRNLDRTMIAVLGLA